MVVLNVRFDSPLFGVALSESPATALEFEDGFPYSEDNLRLVVRAHAGDLDAFETGLHDDSYLGPVKLISAPGPTRVYRVLLPRERPEARIYESLVGLDGYVIEGTCEDREWSFRLSFPDREAVVAFNERCVETDLKPMITSVHPVDDADDTCRYGLTEVQGETLLTALSAGYFDVPRRARLSDLAESLDVSDQAVSERIRRGTSRLVANTIGESN
jgi:hypothetical protein